MKLVAVYGPPGTGKTTYLLNKFYQAVKDEHYLPAEILYTTFRRLMANDFKKRLIARKIVDSENELTFVSTIHSIAWRLLAREFSWNKKDNVALPWHDYVNFCKDNGIPVVKEDVSKVKALDEDLPIFTPQDFESLGFKIYSIYCNCINTLTPFDKFESLPEYMLPDFSPTEKVTPEHVMDIINQWIDWLEKNEKVDFAMMLQKCLDLKLKPDVTIAMFDEAHDMTPIQWKLFAQWVKGCNEVYVAFDLAQTIYSFWGVKPQYCVQVWEKAHEKIVLTPSYRLSRAVFSKAKSIVNKAVKVPDIQCVGNTKYKFIYPTQILKVVESFKPIAILVRTKHHMDYLANKFYSHGVIFRSIYGHGWSSRMLNVYKVLWHLKNNTHNFSKEEFLDLIKSINEAYLTANKKEIVRCVRLNDLTPNLIKNCLKPSFFEALRTLNPFNTSMFLNTSDNPNGFSRSTLNAMSMAWFSNKPPQLEAEIYTIHGSKGLEWDNVLVIDGITRKIHRCIMRYKEELENEFRVWYVAFTRARKFLFYTTSHVFAPGLDIPFLGRVV